MKNEKVPLSWVIGRSAYIYERCDKMKKFMLGSLFTLLVNYCVGSTILLYKNYYKGSDKKCSN